MSIPTPPPLLATPYAPPPKAAYARWIQRVAAKLVDVLAALAVLFVPAAVGVAMIATGSTSRSDGTMDLHGNGVLGAVVLGLGVLAAVLFQIWNVAIRQGRTGYSIGKQALGIKLISQLDGKPVGAWFSLGRQLAMSVNSVPLYVGWLWPIWDKKRQTLTDKLVHTYVINAQSTKEGRES